jgi:hypothetical protein
MQRFRQQQIEQSFALLLTHLHIHLDDRLIVLKL